MKETLSSRERVLRAVSLKEPDRVPLDFGSHINSSIHRTAYANLVEFLHLPGDSPPQLVNRMMQDVAIDPPVLETLGIDTRGVFQGSPEVIGTIDLEAGTWDDEWGVFWRMPKGGHYYDLFRAPLAGEISIHDISSYPWPDPDDPGISRPIQQQIDRLRRETDCALILNLPSMFVHQSQYMRGFQDWYLDLAAQPSLSEALFDAVLEIKMGYATQILKVAGNQVDIVMTADDMGSQKSLQFSPDLYRRMFKPRNARYMDLIRRYSDAPILLHTCGSVFDIVDDLADIGVQILNPVQTRAANMAPELLKERFGNKMAFWGAVDIQHVLPFGDETEVRNEVQHLFRTLGAGGGWVISPSHNIQPEVPAKNLVTMYGEALENCWY